MISLRQRALNAMFGLAIGDALSWPAMFHRSHLLPAWTRRIRREMDVASEASNVLTLPMPFSLNQPADVFDIGPTDDTEWAAFTTKTLIEYEDEVKRGFRDAWLTLATSESVVRGSISVQSALKNLRNKKLPPQSGKENPHYFDDGALSRAVPIGIFCNGDPSRAAQMAALDASVTNAEDGVWAAQAMAVTICLACTGKDLDEILARSLELLPSSSLVHRKVASALTIVGGCKSLFSVLPKLQNTIVNREYSYGNASPETLALVFVIAKMIGKDVERAISAAASFAKTSDSLPAIVGALAGAMNDEAIVSEDWLDAVSTLKGVCIPSLAGVNYVGLAECLADLAIGNQGKRT